MSVMLVACGHPDHDGHGPSDTPAGATSEEEASGEVRLVPASEVVERLSDAPGDLVLLDVRSPSEFESGHIAGARNIPVNELETRLAELDNVRDQEVIVFCEMGGRAVMAEGLLQGAGFARLGHLEGDMSAWRAAGHPLE
jgi:rhodanese-related sulfurtransferase